MVYIALGVLVLGAAAGLYFLCAWFVAIGRPWLIAIPAFFVVVFLLYFTVNYGKDFMIGWRRARRGEPIRKYPDYWEGLEKLFKRKRS